MPKWCAEGLTSVGDVYLKGVSLPTFYLGLYKNAAEPAADDEMTAITEAAVPGENGYERIALNLGDWAESPAGVWTHAAQAFLADGGDWGLVTGFFVTTAETGTAGDLVCVKHFPQGPYQISDKAGMAFVPIVTNVTEFSPSSAYIGNIQVVLIPSAGYFLEQAIEAYWVSPTGAATWANAQSETPLSGTACCSRATANANASPGNTVYFRGGTYSGITGSAIDPANSGTVGNVITFSSYSGEDVQFVGSGVSSRAIDLDSEYGTVRNYVKLHDLHFTNFMDHLWIRKGSHNEISYCSCIGYPAGATQSQFAGTWSASYIYRQATHNWVHHSTFGLWGYNAVYGYDTGVVFQVGLESSTTDFTQYNTVEDCHFYGGGHHVISFNGKFNSYRNIYCHNEPWYPLDVPVFATRTMFQTGYPGDGCYNLVEGCRIGYGGPKNKDEIGGAGGTMAGANNIWRGNIFLQVYTDGIYMTKYSGQSDVTKNKVYNNTFWKGGYGPYQVYPTGTAPSLNWEDRYTHAICVEEGSSGSGVFANSFKNNLFYQNKDVLGTQYSIISRYYDQSLGWITRVPIFQDIENNWFDNAGDPKFVDIAGTPDPMDQDQWDFNLQASSPCIGAGGSLTLASGSGSGSVTLVVDDAMYFQDGTWGSSLSAKSADWIAIGTVGNIVQISSIDYATNTITLASPMTWADDAPIWLYKNSAGERVLYGSAPEMGAKPYVA